MHIQMEKVLNVKDQNFPQTLGRNDGGKAT